VAALEAVADCLTFSPRTALQEISAMSRRVTMRAMAPGFEYLRSFSLHELSPDGSRVE
jgi:hypothetical protein